eukprot:9016585-Karenia_brevis.AAC.1
MNPRLTWGRGEGTAAQLQAEELDKAAWYFSNAFEDKYGVKRNVEYNSGYVPRDVIFTKGLRMLAADAHN